ncbi:MAG: methyltransferase domain-containing protein [Terriglobia bacterium]
MPELRLVLSDPVLPEEELSRLYRGSAFAYEEEFVCARLTYAEYVRESLPLLKEDDRLLDIGCGNGFFLEKALELGFAEVDGVEPSR